MLFYRKFYNVKLFRCDSRPNAVVVRLCEGNDESNYLVGGLVGGPSGKGLPLWVWVKQGLNLLAQEEQNQPPYHLFCSVHYFTITIRA